MRLPLLLVLLLSSSSVSAQHALDHFQISNCSAPFERKVWTALHYITTMMDRNNAINECVRRANTAVVPLSTRHEFTAVGPYVPCNSTSSSYRERAQAYVSPQLEPIAALSALLPMFSSSYPSTISIVCSPERNETAWTLNTHRYGYGHQNPVTVYLGEATWTSRPDHEPLQNELDRDFGPTFDHRDQDQTYPVEELVGIILHELTHTHNYSHGTSANECGYTSYDCTGSASGRSCRANSIPEIIEACASEVVSRSIKRCSYAAPFRNFQRITPVTSTYDGSSCTWAHLEDSRDGRAYHQPFIEGGLSRNNGRSSDVAAASSTHCRQLCGDSSTCTAFTYTSSSSNPWWPQGRCNLMSDAVFPPTLPTELTTMHSGVVRVPHGAGMIEYHIDRPGSDYRKLFLNGPTAAGECQELCLSDSRCVAMSFLIRADDGTGTCWLKDRLRTAVTRQNILTFRK